MPNRPTRLICFDLGGVLIRICRDWSEACRAAGLPDVTHHSRFMSSEARASLRQLSHGLTIGILEIDDFSRKVCDCLGGALSVDQVRQAHDAVLVGEYPGVRNVIEELTISGYRTAALSNTDRAHWQRILTFPAVMALHERLTSFELGLAKPDPAIFEAAQRRLGALPGEILYFDDLAENIDAARAVGWDAVLIDHAGATEQQIRSALEQRCIRCSGA